jgi:ubiquinone/menaquinone biosynthesis C-methylase UbiE
VRIRGRTFVRLFAAIFVIGAFSTFLWIGSTAGAAPPSAVLSMAALRALAVCLALTSINLAARWLRWHFLIRRFTRRIATRDSLIVYLATLPAIVTPFFLGELVRVIILGRRPGTKASQLAWVWLIERLLDASVLLAFLLLVVNLSAGLLLIPVVAGASFVMFSWLLDDQPARHAAKVAGVALLTTVAAWLLPILALLATLAQLGEPIGAGDGVRAFSTGTLLGGLTGLPLGVAVTGSTMIRELTVAGVSVDTSVAAVMVYRLGTAFYAVALGLTSFVVWRHRLASIMRTGAGHFDDIADAYEEQIPRHVRDRLLIKKTALIREQLAAVGIPAQARGLDLGCGHGWYLAQFARDGYRMSGLDYSVGQLARAQSNLAQDGQRRPLLQGDAVQLPFPDHAFDFVYSINAFHHFPSVEAQVQAVGEAVRVLRPGGALILHEINTQNPVFRLYMGYVFPLLNAIDEGTEQWLLPARLPVVAGARWLPAVTYFTFTPDFIPRVAQRLLARVEQALERSRWRRLSAHYQVCLVKDSGLRPS